MTARFRSYGLPDDYELVGRFLVASYQSGNRDGNWLRSRWDYMHTHPALDRSTLGCIGLEEDAGRLVAVVNHEDRPGTAYLHFAPGYRHLAPAALAYAEEVARGTAPDGAQCLRVYAFEGWQDVEAVLLERGYELDGKYEQTSALAIAGKVESACLPDGFRMQSLADEDDLVKVHRVIWRGFNHPGEPPAGDLVGRALMQSGPKYRHDLNIVVKAPNGDYASYAGIWFEPENRTAMVEPVATDPSYRRMGLGRAAVLEAVRRCAAEGATVAYVGSGQPFYGALGFRPVFRHLRWSKQLR